MTADEQQLIARALTDARMRARLAAKRETVAGIDADALARFAGVIVRKHARERRLGALQRSVRTWRHALSRLFGS